MEPIIRIENLSKKYILSHQSQAKESYTALRDVITNKTKSVFQKKSIQPKTSFEEFWALKNISFDINQGDRIGIIGRNGAGKSTLLKIISHITEPTSGRVVIDGKVASLLEVGTGFHPELTGRENIFLNGSILGMSRREIQAKFDEIVAFSEVEKFLDTPVKRFSSGMYVRLAFAVAAHLEPDILIVDEVLAVGDSSFQKKCLGKIKEVSGHGRTVIFVSHNMGAISQLCNRAILLKSGEIFAEGKTSEVTAQYFMLNKAAAPLTSVNFSGPLSGIINFLSIKINDKDSSDVLYFSPKEELTFEIKAHSNTTMHFRTTLALFRNGERIMSMNDVKNAEEVSEGDFTSIYKLPSYFLRPGEYLIAIGGNDETTKGITSDWIWGTDLVCFNIMEEWDEKNEIQDIGVINAPYKAQRVL